MWQNENLSRCFMCAKILLVFITFTTANRLPLEVFQHHPERPEHILHHHRPDNLLIPSHRIKPETKDVRILYQIGVSIYYLQFINTVSIYF